MDALLMARRVRGLQKEDESAERRIARRQFEVQPRRSKMRDENYTNAASKLAEPQHGEAMAGRMNTKAMLLGKAENIRPRTHQLESLAYAIENVRGDAEAMLHRLLSAHIYR